MNSIITDRMKEDIFYIDFFQYTLTSDDINKITEYENGRAKSAWYYAANRSTSKEKAKEDIKSGKYGEVASSGFLKFIWPEIPEEDLEPDFNIYEVKQKDYSPDLAKFCHVKATTMKWRYGTYSWTFQLENNSNGHGRDRIFDMTNEELSREWGIFVFMSEDLSVGEVKFMIRMDIVRKLLRDPIVKKYIGEKLCLYSDDLFGILGLTQ